MGQDDARQPGPDEAEDEAPVEQSAAAPVAQVPEAEQEAGDTPGESDEYEPSPVEQEMAEEAAKEEKRLAGVIGRARTSLRKGGYPLEYEAEETFAEAGFRIRRGFHYDDPDTGKRR